MTTKVQITVELLEKLAGIQPKTRHHPQQQRHRQQQPQLPQQRLSRFGNLGLPGTPGTLPPHLSQNDLHKQHEQDLQQSIQESQRVGELLLKSGDKELAAVQQQADKLLSKFKSQIKPLPCGPERAAVLKCYTGSPQDVLACSELIDAYYACAQHS